MIVQFYHILTVGGVGVARAKLRSVGDLHRYRILVDVHDSVVLKSGKSRTSANIHPIAERTVDGAVLHRKLTVNKYYGIVGTAVVELHIFKGVVTTVRSHIDEFPRTLVLVVGRPGQDDRLVGSSDHPDSLVFSHYDGAALIGEHDCNAWLNSQHCVTFKIEVAIDDVVYRKSQVTESSVVVNGAAQRGGVGDIISTISAVTAVIIRIFFARCKHHAAHQAG